MPDDFWQALANTKASKVSPFRRFSARQWTKFRADTPLTLDEAEVDDLRSLGDGVDIEEVRRIYLSITRLMLSHVDAHQTLFDQRARFLALKGDKTPFIIGIAGSVAVGKSTTARLLRALLARSPGTPKVDLVTTDGFLHPNAELESRGIMKRKGFPESYDVGAILRFLSDVKAGRRRVKAPLYSHLSYDVLSDKSQTVDQPDILIFEGINVLQASKLPMDGKAVPVVSDFFDFSIYIDATEQDLREWYISRFMRLRETAFADPNSFFHRYASLSEAKAQATAERLWRTINLVNLRNTILPTRPRADLVMRKQKDHRIAEVALRKL
jgi:type I pantothenate kinase